jgi:ADP-ribose pyrophosphatase
MRMPRPLPPAPEVRAAIVRDGSATAAATGGFVNVRRLEVSVTSPEGKTSAPFRFDIATRRAIDAVVVVAHFAADGEPQVYLRSCPRPALMLHDGPTGPREGNLWELAAGLVEPDETPRHGAARELHEELGFQVDEARLVPLGAFTYPAPGFIAEQHHYFHVEVDPAARQPPAEDGSPLEENASVIHCSLADALEHCRAGRIVDAKTELALRRLAELPGLSPRTEPAP